MQRLKELEQAMEVLNKELGSVDEIASQIKAMEVSLEMSKQRILISAAKIEALLEKKDG